MKVIISQWDKDDSDEKVLLISIIGSERIVGVTQSHWFRQRRDKNRSANYRGKQSGQY